MHFHCYMWSICAIKWHSSHKIWMYILQVTDIQLRASDLLFLSFFICFFCPKPKILVNFWSKMLDQLKVQKLKEVKVGCQDTRQLYKDVPLQNQTDFVKSFHFICSDFCKGLSCKPWSVPAPSSQGRCGTPGWCHLRAEACTARWSYCEGRRAEEEGGKIRRS